MVPASTRVLVDAREANLRQPFSRFYLSTPRQRVFAVLSIVSVAAFVAAGVAGVLTGTHAAHASISFKFQDSHFFKLGLDDAAFSDNNPDDAAAAVAAADRAYPATHVAPDQMVGASKAFEDISNNWGADNSQESWKLVGPTTTTSSQFWTYTGNAFNVSGRITALGIGSSCQADDCRFYVGAAGGGIWRTDDALANPPSWKSVSNGLFTNAIGSIWVDPHNSRHVQVGTGEESGSSDSEAGLGLFETWNAGNYWQLVPGSFAVAAGRSIGAVAVDPANPAHIFIGTDVARHGASSVNGGRFAPPNAPRVGLYESTDGGQSFSLVFSKASDSVNPASGNGSDFFRGGVTDIQFDSTTAGRIYLSMFDYGLFRSDGSGGYEQVYATPFQGNPGLSSINRVEFALAPLARGKLRIYLGDARTGTARLLRVDDAGVSAATLTTGTTNPGWTALSSNVNGTPGFASFNFCGGQCSYDMVVVSPAGHPDTVWISGQMQYGDLLRRSNGRAVQRSTDAGVSFTDMTNDASFNGLHPDHHALVFDPGNPDVAFSGSDGGVVRTSGPFVNQANDPNLGCGVRGLSGANLTDCQNWLSAVPTQNISMNAGLATLQFQSVSVNPSNVNDVQGGTQDNGTLLRQGKSTTWFEQVGGDGGQSGYNVANPNIRFHSYFAPQHDVNFKNGDPLSWDWISDPFFNPNGTTVEAASFYTPIIADPKVGGTMFDGLQHVWRTQDNGGSQAYLDTVCNEFTGTFATKCGDWVPLGGTALNGPGDLSGTFYGTDKGGGALPGDGPSGNYVAAITRSSSNNGTMWVATRRGRVFVSTNADAADPNAVTFTRIDTLSTPTRFISGIAVDPQDPNHAFISFSGYDAYAIAAGTATGHVFDVHFNGTTATWTDISGNVGDQPVTGIAYDSAGHSLYIATDFTVLRMRLNQGGNWRIAASGLPLVAVWGITLAPQGNVLYAATHGRGTYRLDIDQSNN
jgi:hypothetical protein